MRNYVPRNFYILVGAIITNTRAHAHKITHAHVKCCILHKCSKTEVGVKCTFQFR